MEVKPRINPTVFRTQNVAKEIFDFAKRNGVEARDLDFNILSFQTLTRVSNGSVGDWVEVDTFDKKATFAQEDILNSKFEIKQVYEIEVFLKHQDSYFKDFKAVVGANSTRCKVYLVIKASSYIKYFPNFENAMLDFINKAKIRSSILIDVFDDMLMLNISKLSAKARVNGELRFDSDENILIASSYEPTPTINDKLIYHYNKSKIKIDNKDRVDHSNRGFIQSVMQDEVLIEYIKPKIGSAGRNCGGEYIGVVEPQSKNSIDFSVDKNTIDVIEDENRILYKSKIGGYIYREANAYTIKSTMDLKEISFKTTGSIYAGIDSGVKLSVSESNYENDAVGDGMVVEVSELNVHGNIGSNVKIYTRRVSIDGQTHKSSHIESDEANLNVHKGTLKAKKARVTRLEQGSIEANDVFVLQAMGGVIRAANIELEICSSNLRAYASKSIVINKLQGSENSFIIDPLMLCDDIESFNANQDSIKELENSQKEINLEIVKYEKMVKDTQMAYQDIVKRISYYKQNDVKIPFAILNKLKELTKIREHLDLVRTEHNEKIQKRDLLISKSQKFQDFITQARVINRDKWVGHNEIIFRLIEPRVDLSFRPSEGMEDKIFGLVKDKDGNYEIKALAK